MVVNSPLIQALVLWGNVALGGGTGIIFLLSNRCTSIMKKTSLWWCSKLGGFTKTFRNDVATSLLLVQKINKNSGDLPKGKEKWSSLSFFQNHGFFFRCYVAVCWFQGGCFFKLLFLGGKKIGRCWKCIVSQVILTSVEGWNVAVKDVLKWKKVWDWGGKNGEDWEAMMFWQLYWNCIKFWKPVIC